MLFVRWLGAFRHGSSSLHDALKFELNRYPSDEVAVEPIKEKSHIGHARVGLLVDKKAVFKVFNGDCWSERERVSGRLYKTRNPRHAPSRHLEGWANPHYIAIVVSCGKGRNEKEGFYNLPKKIRSTIKWYSSLYNLPVLHLVGNKLKEVDLKKSN